MLSCAAHDLRRRSQRQERKHQQHRVTRRQKHPSHPGEPEQGRLAQADEDEHSSDQRVDSDRGVQPSRPDRVGEVETENSREISRHHFFSMRLAAEERLIDPGVSRATVASPYPIGVSLASTKATSLSLNQRSSRESRYQAARISN